MLGQKKLMDDIERLLEAREFPRFSIVLGERGAEHRDVARYVANYMSATYVELLDVKVDTVRNMISEAYRSHGLTVYCIPNADDMSIVAKNAMLKVAEEAPNKSYIIMCLEDMNNTLMTIQSRAQIFKMCIPSPIEVEDFARSLYVNESDIDEEAVHIIGELCRTEGEVCMLTKMGAKNFYRYVEWFTENVFTLPSAESFKLAEKVSVKDDDGKYDCLLFMRAFQYVLWRQSQNSNGMSYRALMVIIEETGKYMQDLRIKGINRQMLLDNWILGVRKIWKSLM